MKKTIKQTLAIAMTAATLLAVPVASMSVAATDNATTLQASNSDNYTFVEVPAKHADKVLKAMSNAKIKGRSINIEKAQGGRKKKGRRK